MNNIKLIAVVSLIMTVFLTGCRYDMIKVNNPLTEDEIITYVQDRIYEETGDRVTAEIISKRRLRVTTLWIDGPVAQQSVDGGYEYRLEITSRVDKNVVATALYRDGYIIYDKDDYPDGSVSETYFSTNYVNKKGLSDVEKEFTAALDKRFDDYRFYRDIGIDTGFDIFICSQDYEKINGLLDDLRDTVNKYRDQEYVTYSVYIYKDRTVYENTDFDLYKKCHQSYTGQSFGEEMLRQFTGKEVVRLSVKDSFDQEFFESDGTLNGKIIDDYDRDSLEYIVFWYSAEPNAFIALNTPDLYAFGVK